MLSLLVRTALEGLRDCAHKGFAFDYERTRAVRPALREIRLPGTL